MIIALRTASSLLGRKENAKLVVASVVIRQAARVVASVRREWNKAKRGQTKNSHGSKEREEAEKLQELDKQQSASRLQEIFEKCIEMILSLMDVF